MINKDTETVEREVARIDGFLAGLAAMNGGLRDYSSFCYIVQLEGERSIDKAIKSFYHWHPQLRFSSVKRLESGARDLERLIRPYLVRDLVMTSQGDLSNLRHLLSFKVMDMMSSLFEGPEPLEVFELHSEFGPRGSECVYYGICAEHVAVVLQFNDDRRFESDPED